MQPENSGNYVAQLYILEKYATNESGEGVHLHHSNGDGAHLLMYPSTGGGGAHSINEMKEGFIGILRLLPQVGEASTCVSYLSEGGGAHLHYQRVIQ